jgi:hypothetical protein
MDISKELLAAVIENLENAVGVSIAAIKDEDKGYPFASGYSRAAMTSAIRDLKYIQEQLSK